MIEKLPGERFTDKESQVLVLLATGKKNAQIAEILSVSERTVCFHIGNILKKLNAANRTEAVVKALREGIFDL